MNKNSKSLLATLLCLVMVLGLAPITAFAANEEIAMNEGEVRTGFVTGKGYSASSSDPSIAWVDGDGALNAMRAGTAEITVSGPKGSRTAYTVTVSDYTDGSPTVGRLKLLARYNDAMQFYDGHVYLLFTAYRDGVEITVDDLYGGYRIADRYYPDVRNALSAGSHRTGAEPEKYFTFDGDMKTMVLNKGEIVTIGMYRGFDLSVPQAALGALRNSSLWSRLSDAAKTAAADAILELFANETLTAEAAQRRLATLLESVRSIGYTNLIDGEVEGGVCFNRELYNQKLEYDQYENVTYELDVTQKQLDALTATLGGNLDHFSVFKNSCATVALKAWNAAVGVRDGERTAYYLEPNGTGIFALMDAPKNVRDVIVERLPGCYLNNSEKVAEPGAGYREASTGEWVYVSAPETVPNWDGSSSVRKLFVTTDGVDADEIKVRTLSGKIAGWANLVPGTVIRVYLPDFAAEGKYLKEFTFNGTPIDPAGDSVTLIMPDATAQLRISAGEYLLQAKKGQSVQIERGERMDVADYVETSVGDRKLDDPSGLVWTIADEKGVVTYADGSHKTLLAQNEGTAYICAWLRDSEVYVFFAVEVVDDFSDMAPVAWDVVGDGLVEIDSRFGGVTKPVLASGDYVKVGSELSLRSLSDGTSVISEVTWNGERCADGDKIVVGKDGGSLSVRFSPAELSGVPQKIVLENENDTFKIDAKVLCKDGRTPFFGEELTYESANPLVTVDANGVVRVAGAIPTGGLATTVTVRAGDALSASARVIAGDYDGDRIVGRLTIAARRIDPGYPILPHGFTAFTPYEPIDLDVSYAAFFEPSEQYKALMRDYADHPSAYSADPAMLSDALDIDDRESYFDIRTPGGGTAPETISLAAGETVTLSAYSFTDNVTLVQDALRNGQIATSENTQELLAQFDLYRNGGAYSGPEFYDALRGTCKEILAGTLAAGSNPADGITEGGISLDRELYNIFAVDGAILNPNVFYTVEITLDEYSAMEDYVSNPANNGYSVMVRNCVTTSAGIWNAALYDRPALQLRSSVIGLADTPSTLRRAIRNIDDDADGMRGRNFYPHFQYEPQSTDPAEEYEKLGPAWYDKGIFKALRGVVIGKK